MADIAISLSRLKSALASETVAIIAQPAAWDAG